MRRGGARPNEIRVPPGAVDLSSLRRPAPETGNADGPGGEAGSPGGSAPDGLVIDVTEATFEAEVVNRSMQVPVVIDFWATWCGPCKQLSPVLEKLVADDGGRWLLAKIDCDAEQRLAQAFQIQSIPSVLAVIGGQPVPLFQGALPEGQVRQVLDEVLRVAEANGVTGQIDLTGEEPTTSEPAPPPRDPAYDEAEAALQRGEMDAAVASYRSLVERDPTDAIAKSSLARAELLARTRGADDRAARSRAADDADDVDAAMAVADLDMLTGHVDDAVQRLVDAVRANAGDDRDRARTHLLSLLDILDPDDPRLVTARRSLANALF